MSTIVATGVRGFLLWLKQQQPGIYQKVAPQLPTLVPEAFTQTERQLGALREIYSAQPFGKRTPQRLGCYYMSFCDIDSAPVTVDFSCQLSTPIDSPVVDYSAQLCGPVDVGTICPGPTPTLSDTSTGTDIASAANTGVTSTGTASAIGSAVNGVAGTLLTADQAAALASIVAAQLGNAVKGTTPNAVSTKAAGIPTVEAKPSGYTDLVLLGIAALAGWLVLS